MPPDGGRVDAPSAARTREPYFKYSVYQSSVQHVFIELHVRIPISSLVCDFLFPTERRANLNALLAEF
jgi:hypothetical protein